MLTVDDAPQGANFSLASDLRYTLTSDAQFELPYVVRYAINTVPLRASTIRLLGVDVEVRIGSGVTDATGFRGDASTPAAVRNNLLTHLQARTDLFSPDLGPQAFGENRVELGWTDDRWGTDSFLQDNLDAVQPNMERSFLGALRRQVFVGLSFRYETDQAQIINDDIGCIAIPAGAGQDIPIHTFNLTAGDWNVLIGEMAYRLNKNLRVRAVDIVGVAEGEEKFRLTHKASINENDFPVPRLAWYGTSPTFTMNSDDILTIRFVNTRSPGVDLEPEICFLDFVATPVPLPTASFTEEIVYPCATKSDNFSGRVVIDPRSLIEGFMQDTIPSLQEPTPSPLSQFFLEPRFSEFYIDVDGQPIQQTYTHTQLGLDILNVSKRTFRFTRTYYSDENEYRVNGGDSISPRRITALRGEYKWVSVPAGVKKVTFETGAKRIQLGWPTDPDLVAESQVTAIGGAFVSAHNGPYTIGGFIVEPNASTPDPNPLAQIKVAVYVNDVYQGENDAFRTFDSTTGPVYIPPFTLPGPLPAGVFTLRLITFGNIDMGVDVTSNADNPDASIWLSDVVGKVIEVGLDDNYWNHIPIHSTFLNRLNGGPVPDKIEFYLDGNPAFPFTVEYLPNSCYEEVVGWIGEQNNWETMAFERVESTGLAIQGIEQERYRHISDPDDRPGFYSDITVAQDTVTLRSRKVPVTYEPLFRSLFLAAKHYRITEAGFELMYIDRQNVTIFQYGELLRFQISFTMSKRILTQK